MKIKKYQKMRGIFLLVFIILFGFPGLFAFDSNLVLNSQPGNDSPKKLTAQSLDKSVMKIENANAVVTRVGNGLTIHIDVSDTFTCGILRTYNFDIPNVVITSVELLIYGSDYDADNDGDYTDFWIKVNENDVIPWATPLEQYGLPVDGNFGDVTFDITSNVVVGTNELYLENTEYAGQPDYTVINYVEIIVNGGGTTPNIYVTPTALTQQLQPDETATQNLTIGNDGDAVLNFNISIENQILANIVRQRHQRNLLAPVAPIYPDGETTDLANGGEIEPYTVSNFQVPGNGSWTACAPLLQARAQHGMVAHPKRKIYVFGGYAGTEKTSLEIYNPASNSWTTGAPLPTADRGMATALDNNGNIYSFSALSTGRSNRYNPTTNSWASILNRL